MFVQNHYAEDVERLCNLLANDPVDRAWRRRGHLVFGRTQYPVCVCIGIRTPNKFSMAEAEWGWCGKHVDGGGGLFHIRGGGWCGHYRSDNRRVSVKTVRFLYVVCISRLALGASLE